MSSRSFSRRSSFRAFDGEPLQQVVPVGLDHLRALERQRQPEDRRERAAELVRHGGEERVLHLVERAEALGGLALPLLRFAERMLGELALGDVGDHARAAWRAVPRRHG